MGIMNIPYDPRTDPNALFAQGAQNVVGGLLQGRQMRNLAGFAGSMDPEATAMQIVTAALSKGISPQIAMGLGGLQQRGQIGPSQMMAGARWNRYQQAKAAGDTDTADRLLSSALVNFNMPTGPQLLTDPQRQELADTGFVEKVSLSPSEKNLARKSAEEILKGTKGRWWSYDLPGKTIPDYTQEMMFENYKTWRAENSYDEQTPRKQKELDDLWDAKMSLWQKSGVKFDKDNIIGKNEIVWNPNDPEVKKIRGAELKNEGLPSLQTAPPTGRDIIGTLQGTPNQRRAIDAIVNNEITIEQKQTLIDQVLRNERIKVKDNAGKIYTLPAEQVADWLAIGGNTLAVE